MLAVFPERQHQSLDLRRSRNLDFFVIKARNIAEKIPVNMDPPKDLQESGRVVLSSELEAFRVGRSSTTQALKMTPATLRTSLDSFVPMPNPAASGNSSTIFFSFSTVRSPVRFGRNRVKPFASKNRRHHLPSSARSPESTRKPLKALRRASVEVAAIAAWTAPM